MKPKMYLLLPSFLLPLISQKLCQLYRLLDEHSVGPFCLWKPLMLNSRWLQINLAVVVNFTGDKLLIRKSTITYVIHEEFKKCYKICKFDEIILKH